MRAMSLQEPVEPGSAFDPMRSAEALTDFSCRFAVRSPGSKL